MNVRKIIYATLEFEENTLKTLSKITYVSVIRGAVSRRSNSSSEGGLGSEL